MTETREELLERHLRDFKKFEFDERMLRQKYEKALEEITRESSEKDISYAKLIASKALGKMSAERIGEIQEYDI